MADRRFALVTGSSSGMGQATAKLLAERGCDVGITYGSRPEGADATRQAVEAAGGRAAVFNCDVSSEPEVLAMVEACRSEFGRIDYLVNAAGTTVKEEPRDLAATSLEAWDRIFAVNVKGTFIVTRAAAPALRAARGSVVNMSSIAGVRPTLQPHAYAASKGAVATLTKTLATALGPEIRVNAVLPGWVLGSWMQEQLGENYEWLNERRAKATPLRRVATNEDVAEVIVSVLESLAFVTGQLFVVDGGFSSAT